MRSRFRAAPCLCRVFWIAAAAGGLAVRSGAAPDGDTVYSGVETGRERPVARCFIPSDQRREGEVRLRAGDSGPALDILLYTKSPGRAFREMRDAETANWPEGKAWHAHSARYLEALTDFRAHLRAQEDAAADDASGVCRVLITFERGAHDSTVALYDVEYEGPPDALTVASRRLFRKLTLAGHYVPSNQYLIVEGSFGTSPDETAELFEQAAAILTKD